MENDCHFNFTTIYFKLNTPYNATMHYLAVLVADPSYHGTEALTYSSEESLAVGSLVYVPLRLKRVLGIVSGTSTDKPPFAVKAATAIDAPPLPAELIATLEWLYTYYPAPLGAVVQQFLPKDLPKKEKPPLPYAAPDTSSLPSLTSEQHEALAGIEPRGLHILHGETGSGKTRVYIELALRAFSAGKSALIATPEIGLTPQLEVNFRNIFGDRVIVLHSQLTEATRRKIWLHILRESKPLILIGPRSILFAPVKKPGVIILDEAHETAYKQDKAPYYHASVVASKLASLHEIPLVLGSATPLVSDYFIASQKQRPILRMAQTAKTATTNEITIVDIRDHGKFGKNSHLSDLLIAEIKKTLSNKEQVLLFLNRRGTARIIMCESCGWQAVCPHCDLPMVYHNDTHTIRCHTCNFTAKPPTSCVECHNASILFKSIGTKAITEEIQRLFPDANVSRYDTDNKKGERIEHHYDAVRDGKVDILVGTQTLAKGLDLPKLSLVGVVIADTSLFVPDFSAQERTYQLLHQVVGRVGRGHSDGKVIIQTYSPESPILQAIVRKDWKSFYDREISERKQFLFPPYCYVLKLWCRRASQQSAQNAATQLAKELQRTGRKIRVEGPAPAFHERADNKYQWQLIVKTKQRSELLDIIKALPSGWSHDIDPMNLL